MCETCKELKRAAKQAGDALRANDTYTAQRILDRVLPIVRPKP